MLYRAFVRTNDRCVVFLKSTVEESNIYIGIGVLLVLIGGRILFLALGLRKRRAETAGTAGGKPDASAE
jgi:hypothetical protein